MHDNRNCEECQEVYQPKDKDQKYCSSSCAATSNNLKFPRGKRVVYPRCTGCDKVLKHPKSICCNDCRFTQRNKEFIEKWLSGEGPGGTDVRLSKTVRDYLLKEALFSCQRCGFDTPHPDDGKTILEINHIDGNGINHTKENLEVICPNCHALTSSYRGRNIGNGRPVFYHRNAKEDLGP